MLRVLVSLTLFLHVAVSSQDARLPTKEGSTRFAVIGDTGTGDSHQAEVAKTLTAWRMKFPYEFVLMMGDNLYGGDEAQDYRKKFEVPYKPLLDAGVRFFALDSNYVDDKQLEWLDKELAASGSDWKICFFHHPLYSSGETHGS